MDPSKDIGKIKEQVEREHISRRRYPKKWGKLSDPEMNKFYNPNEINSQLKESLKLQDLCPFKYTGEGESFFLSRDMYNALCTQCRCGRPRTGTHMLRCLQKERDKFANKNEDAVYNESMRKNEEKTEKRQQPKSKSNTSVGLIREKPIYQQWEQSMKYISPVYTMPGFRITARPYNAFKIG